MKKIIVSIVLLSFFIGCNSSKSHKKEVLNPTPQEQNETKPQERIKHDDIEIIRLWGFEDACKNCNKGYRTKLVCGYAYNPKCAKQLSSLSSIESEITASELILQDIDYTIKEVQNGNK